MREFFQKIRDATRNTIEFLKDTRKELKNVSWPTRSELTGTTLVVIIAVFLFGFFLQIIDTIANAGITYIFHRAATL